MTTSRPDPSSSRGPAPLTRRGALAALSGLALAGCGGNKMPALSAVVDAPLLRPGSSWTYRIEDSSFNQPVTATYVFDREDVYKGGGVLSFTVGQETLLYDRDLNFVAVAAGGRILREASPSYRAFDFPFYVGKEWRSVFTFQDYVRTLSWVPVEVYWKVEEYDVTKVPAGDFRTFLLVSRPSTNWGLEEQIWYAPEVRQSIRWRHTRSAAHYLGKGKQSGELVQYTLR
jgi:hypothetical protein